MDKNFFGIYWVIFLIGLVWEVVFVGVLYLVCIGMLIRVWRKVIGSYCSFVWGIVNWRLGKCVSRCWMVICFFSWVSEVLM